MAQTKNRRTAALIRRAIETAGGQKALADAIQVAPAFVWQWANAKRPVPAHHCLAIEAATRAVVTRHDLRPDVFGPKAA
jgi:DNA-binding transcriptional regulator YdaS (Cro superfamily)